MEKYLNKFRKIQGQNLPISYKNFVDKLWQLKAKNGFTWLYNQKLLDFVFVVKIETFMTIFNT